MNPKMIQKAENPNQFRSFSFKKCQILAWLLKKNIPLKFFQLSIFGQD